MNVIRKRKYPRLLLVFFSKNMPCLPLNQYVNAHVFVFLYMLISQYVVYLDVMNVIRKPFVRSGIRTHAYRCRLRPERSALDRSAILTMKNEGV